MANNEPELIKKGQKKANKTAKNKNKEESYYVNGNTVKTKKKKKSGCLTCLVAFCCVVIIVLGGIFGAGFILYEEYVRPIVGISLSEAFGLIKGIYTPDRDKIITNPYDQVADNKAFYSNLKGALCLSDDIEISITDILNETLSSSTQNAAETGTTPPDFSTGNEYFDNLLRDAKFDFSSLENYDGKAKYFNITDKQLASVLQEALVGASDIEQLKGLEETIGSKLDTVAKVEQLIFTESSSKPKITATLGIDARTLLKQTLLKDADGAIPAFIKDILPSLLPKELLVSLSFFPNTEENAVVRNPIISINTTNDEVLERLFTSIDSYMASNGNAKIFTPVFETVATTINTSLTQVTNIIGKDSLVYEASTNTLKVDTIGAVLMAMEIDTVSSVDFFSMIEHLHSVDFKSKTEEDLQAFLNTVIPNPPSEENLQQDLLNIQNSYGLDTTGWDASNILDNFNEDLVQKLNLAEMNYRSPDDMKATSKLSSKTLALVINEYLKKEEFLPSSTNSTSETGSPTDFSQMLKYITVADINLGKEIITNPNTMQDEEKLFLDLVIKIQLRTYLQGYLNNQIYTNLIMSMLPDNLYFTARVLVTNPQATDKIGISLNFNREGTDSMINTIKSLLTKFSPESADLFDIGNLTEELENVLYPIINGEPNKEGKYLVPIALTFQEGYINLPSLYEVVCIASEAMNLENSDNIFIPTPDAQKVNTVYQSLRGLTDYESVIPSQNIMPDGNIDSPMNSVDLFAENGLVKRELEGNLFLQKNLVQNNDVPVFEQLTSVFSNVNNLDTIENYIDFPSLKTNDHAPSDMNLTISAKEFIKLFDSVLADYTAEIKKHLPYNSLSAFDGRFYFESGAPYVEMQICAYGLANTFPESMASGLGGLQISPNQFFPKYLMLTAQIEFEPEEPTTSPSVFSDLYYYAAGEEPPAPSSNRKINLKINSVDHVLISDLMAMFIKDNSFNMDTVIDQLRTGIDSAFNSLKEQNIDFNVVSSPSGEGEYVLESTNIYHLINTVIFKDSTTPMPDDADLNLQSLILQINDTDEAKKTIGKSNLPNDYTAVNKTLRDNYFLNINDDSVSPLKYFKDLGEELTDTAIDSEKIKKQDDSKDAMEYTATMSAGELGKMIQELVDDNSLNIAGNLPSGMYDTFKVHSLSIAENKSVSIILIATYSPTANSTDGTNDVAKITSLLLPQEMVMSLTINISGGIRKQTIVMNCTTDQSLNYLMSIVNINKTLNDEGYINLNTSLNQVSEQLNTQLDTLTNKGLSYSVGKDAIVLESFYGVMYKLIMNVSEADKKMPAEGDNARKTKATIAQLQESHANVGKNNVSNNLDNLNSQLIGNFGIKEGLDISSPLNDIKNIFRLDNFDAQSFANKTGLGNNGLAAPSNANYSDIRFNDDFDKIRITESELARLLNKVEQGMFNIDFIQSFEMHSVRVTENTTGLAPNLLITYHITTGTPPAGENNNLQLVYSLLPTTMYMSITLDMNKQDFNKDVDKIIINHNDKKTYTDNTNFVFEIMNANQTNGKTISQQEIIAGDGTETNKGVKPQIYNNLLNDKIALHFKDGYLESDNLYPTVYSVVFPDKTLPADETKKLEEALVFKKALYSLYHYKIAENKEISNQQFTNINTSLQNNYFVKVSNLKTDNPADTLADFENKFNFTANDTNTNPVANDKNLTVNNIDLASLINSTLTNQTSVNIDIFSNMRVIDAEIKVIKGYNAISFIIYAEKNNDLTTKPGYFSVMPDALYVNITVDMTSGTHNKITVLGVDGKENGEITALINSLVTVDATSALSTIKTEISNAFETLSKNPSYSENTITFDSFYTFLADKLTESLNLTSQIDAQILKNTLYYLNETARTDEKKLNETDLTFGYPGNRAEHDVHYEYTNLDNSYISIYDSVIQSKDAKDSNFINLRFINASDNETVLNHVFKDFMKTVTKDYTDGKSILATTNITLGTASVGDNSLINKVVPASLYLTLLFKENMNNSKFIINDMPIECMKLFDTLTGGAITTTLQNNLAEISKKLTVTINIAGTDKIFDYTLLMAGEFSNTTDRIAENYAKFMYRDLPTN